MENKNALLVLQDGTVFKGLAIGKTGTTVGEICFNTGMTGYQEIFTDPSYFGQLMVMTNAHIGNYGAKIADAESESIKIAGLICRNFTNNFSRFQAESDLQTYIENQGLVGIADIDTRALVRHIRKAGAMNAIISSEIADANQLLDMLKATPPMEGLELARNVSTAEAYELGDAETAKFRVAVLDFGIKKQIHQNLTTRQCLLRVFPAQTTAKEIEAWQPDGYFLSNGPGDPAAMHYAVETVKTLLATKKPLFGICLGHQLLSLAMDVPTYKMQHGHRGINHPVKNLTNGYCEITSQNHGFAVSATHLRQHEDIEITHINLNDNTIEGIRLKKQPAFSVQYHPEAAPGPHDSRYLFDNFIELIQHSKNK